MKGVKDSLCRRCAVRGGDVCNKYPNHNYAVKVVFRSLIEGRIRYADVQECPNFVEREEEIDDSMGFLNEEGKMKGKNKSIADFIR